MHLAAQAGVRYSLVNPHAYIESNISGFTNILEGCRHNGCQHLLFASSSSVYGANTKLPFSVRDNVDHPISLYAASKKANEAMAQDALRGVMRKVLAEVARTGLPGNHHFYITFKTGAPGVDIPGHLRERFPDEMTIVLQNKFWDLDVSETGFSVGLSFNQMPSKLIVPFSAITAFVDPAVDFGLQFQATVADLAPEPHEDAENDSPTGSDAPARNEDGSNVVSVDFGRKK